MTTTSEKQRGRKNSTLPAGRARTNAKPASSIDSRKSARTTGKRTSESRAEAVTKAPDAGGTAISCCVQDELLRYFDMLDGEKPSGLYRMVIRQAEHALLNTVMRECGGNQSRAAEWLGISRGNLRNKLADMD